MIHAENYSKIPNLEGQMLGGCQKKMFYVKDTKSRLFCEAYFILREGADMSYVCENDLAAEADRILRERFPNKKRRFKKFKASAAALFILGIIAGAGIMYLMK